MSDQPPKVRIDRGRLAQAEHDRQLKEYLRENFDALVRRQKLVADGKVRTNISVLDLPTLEYARPGKESLAMGSGQKGGQGQPGQPGDGQPGEVVDLSGRQGADHHGEQTMVELDFDEFVRLAQEQLLDQLDLPPLGPPRVQGEAPSISEEEEIDIDRPGLMSELDLERTMIESLGRHIREHGEVGYDVDVRRDGWYQVEQPEEARTNRALEVYLLDISGSVSGHNIALIRKFVFVLWYYLDQRYRTNARRFVIFQDEAHEVTRQEFFAIESKGGTHISSGLDAALNCLDGHEQYDKFLFFFSDGDNSSSDDDAAKVRLDAVLAAFHLVCYGRINPCDSPLSPFNKLVREKLAADPELNLTFRDIKDLENVEETLKAFLAVLDP